MLSPKFIGLSFKPPHFPPSPSRNTFNWSQKPTNQNKKKSVENVKWSCTLGLHSWVLTSYKLLFYTPCAKSLPTKFKEYKKNLFCRSCAKTNCRSVVEISP